MSSLVTGLHVSERTSDTCSLCLQLSLGCAQAHHPPTIHGHVHSDEPQSGLSRMVIMHVAAEMGEGSLLWVWFVCNGVMA
jgi:hypothetical protein